MEHRSVGKKELAEFAVELQRRERADGTIEKYQRDVRAFGIWLERKPVTPEAVTGWKAYLLENNYAPVSINAMLAALNAFFRFMGWNDCHANFIKIQRRMFRTPERELTREEYQRLVSAAKATGRERLVLLMETICSTGIRVSEVKYITVESLRLGKSEVSLKGKTRTILLPNQLCQKLKKYAHKQKITSGEIFLTRGGTGISRRQIWAEMKALCKKARVAESKVFPHNLRHLFATVFYQACKDIIRLADVLGHASIETTRIYLLTSGQEHRRQLERLRLVS